MNEVLLIFFSLSLSGAFLALVLLALRPLIKSRVSQTWQYYIWLVVILRFLLPFAPQADVMGEMVQYIQNAGNSVSVVQNTPNIGVNSESTVSKAQNFSQILQILENFESEIPANNAAAAQRVFEPDTLLNNLWLLWACIALVLFVRKITGYRSFARFVKAGEKQITDAHILEIYRTELAAAKVKRELPIFINAHVISPMLIGIFQPALIIPVLEASDDELRHIFRHELTHYKRLDFLYKWIVQMVVCLHWFNPLIYLIDKQINKSCELSCDEAVIKSLNVDGRISYGDALMVSLRSQGKSSNFVVSITMNENGNIVKERLDAIMNYKKKSGLVIFTTILLTTMLLCGFTITGAYADTNTHRDIPDNTLGTEKEVNDTADSNKTAQSNVRPNAEKEGINVADSYKQIVKTLDGTNIQNINIYAELCTLKFEPATSNTFEAIFSYPKITAANYEKYFDLSMEQGDNNTIHISTDYENDHGFDPIMGFDDSDYPAVTTLTIKVPEKRYNKVVLSLSVIGNKTIDFGINTSALEIISNVCDTMFKTDKAFDSLYIDHYVGNFDLQLQKLSKSMNFDIAIGVFTLSLPSDPANISLIINNKEVSIYGDGSTYELPATWKTSITENKVVYEHGNKQNIINVNNKRFGVFAVNIKGIPNDTVTIPSDIIAGVAPQVNSMTATDPSEIYADFSKTSLAKRFVNQTIKNGDYFTWNRIDVVDDNGYAYQAIVFICKGSDRYKEVFNQALEQLYAAYPNNKDIIGYLDLIRDNRLRNYGIDNFSAIEKVAVVDANSAQYNAYVVAICGSDDFMQPYDEFFDKVIDEYYTYEFKP